MPTQCEQIQWLIEQVNALNDAGCGCEDCSESQDNRFKVINFGSASSPFDGPPDLGVHINNLPDNATDYKTVLDDQIPLFVGYVSQGRQRSRFQKYLVKGYGKGTYGQGGDITLVNDDLELVEVIDVGGIVFPPITDDPNADVKDLGEIPGGDFISVLNAGPQFTVTAGTNCYFEFTDGGVRQLWSFDGPNGTYGSGALNVTSSHVFLVYDEGNQAGHDHEGYWEEGTRDGAVTPLTVRIGDHDSSNGGTYMEVDDDNGEINMTGDVNLMGTSLSYYRGLNNLTFLLPSLSANRTQTIQDDDGTLALLKNIPLEKLNEGGGEGIIIRNRIATNYGNVGNQAIDLSFSDGASSTRGATGQWSFATGYNTIASGNFSATFGVGTEASFQYAIATGVNTLASGSASFAGGNGSQVTGENSFGYGTNAQATGVASFATGISSVASGSTSFSIGQFTVASGTVSFAGGQNSQAIGITAFTYGQNCLADGNYSAAFNFDTQASGNSAAAFGRETTASGSAAFATGSSSGTGPGALDGPEASGDYSFAGGTGTESPGFASFVFGVDNEAPSYGEVSFGTFPTLYTPNSATLWDAADRAFNFGNGFSNGQRSDILQGLKGGEVLTPDLDVAKIIAADDKVVTTKEYVRGTRFGDLSLTVAGGWSVDWSQNNAIHAFEVIGATTISEINLPTGSQHNTVRLYITGIAPTFPAAWGSPNVGTYNAGPGVVNKITVDCINGDTGDYFWTIEN